MASQPTSANTSPMPDVARILARFDRAQLEGFIAVAIDLADALDGDSDNEDDDPDTGAEDDPLGFDPESDQCDAGDDGCAPVWRHGNQYWGADNDEPYRARPIADPEAYRDHVRRIRRERCYKTRGYNGSLYRLLNGGDTPTKRQIMRRRRGMPRRPRA